MLIVDFMFITFLFSMRLIFDVSSQRGKLSLYGPNLLIYVRSLKEMVNV